MRVEQRTVGRVDEHRWWCSICNTHGPWCVARDFDAAYRLHLKEHADALAEKRRNQAPLVTVTEPVPPSRIRRDDDIAGQHADRFAAAFGPDWLLEIAK